MLLINPIHSRCERQRSNSTSITFNGRTGGDEEALLRVRETSTDAGGGRTGENKAANQKRPSENIKEPIKSLGPFSHKSRKCIQKTSVFKTEVEVESSQKY
jgi:hypothetical protein